MISTLATCTKGCSDYGFIVKVKCGCYKFNCLFPPSQFWVFFCSWHGDHYLHRIKTNIDPFINYANVLALYSVLLHVEGNSSQLYGHFNWSDAVLRHGEPLDHLACRAALWQKSASLGERSEPTQSCLRLEFSIYILYIIFFYRGLHPSTEIIRNSI